MAAPKDAWRPAGIKPTRVKDLYLQKNVTLVLRRGELRKYDDRVPNGQGRNYMAIRLVDADIHEVSTEGHLQVKQRWTKGKDMFVGFEHHRDAREWREAPFLQSKLKSRTIVANAPVSDVSTND